MVESVRVAGVGATPFGTTPDRTARSLFAAASREAIEDANMPSEDVDEVLYGNFVGTIAEQQGHQGPLMAEGAGVDAPATRVEAACAASGAAVRQAVTAIRAGSADVVLVGGAERMTNLGTESTTEALATAADDLWETRAGVTFPAAYALLATGYFQRYGGTREDLAHVAVKNHEHALDNDLAHYRTAIDIEDVLEAPMVAEPLGLYDACPISDGASALVLASEDYVEEHGVDAPVAITGAGQASDRLALQDRESLAHTPATVHAAKAAYDEAGVGPEAVDVAEVHDCFTIGEVLAIEGLGLFEPGEGIAAARRGETHANGSIPVNLSGGLKAKGHPVGATGTAQVGELTKVLRGDHVNSDAVSDAELGLAHNAGGTVATAVVHVLEVAA